jgi:hypothetical protein
MRGIGIVLILIGLSAIGIKAAAVYTSVDVSPYFGMVVDQARGLVAKYGDYADYGIRGGIVLLGIIFLMLHSGDDE